ncbi:transketolase family protein [Oceanispirochaeta crateris]|uniref:Transketolase family protein n=1 Tax=Oceanispirochaeta crateris TaxID=2518645 RepID=A0A5C1QPV9_9SPIO|nr:transketolase family protein [Oceanispirochaeta crateris]QEN08162.1 transketolase family protein [Oceanispirochaeta crateris]
MKDKKMIRAAYGEALVKLGQMNKNVVVLDADLSHATMTNKFAEKFPERFFNIGIAEANMMNISAGMSTMGYIPFCSTFALFGTGRAYEQIRNSIAYPNFNVKICCTHAGVSVGEDGGSHQAIEDIALMRVIPNMTIVVPCDANETKKAVNAISECHGPTYLRLARSPSTVFDQERPFTLGKANVMKEGTDIVLFACGIMVDVALDCANELKKSLGKSIAVINIHTIKPIDAECVLLYAKMCKKVVTLEEHSVIGGLGAAVAEVLIGKGDFSFKRIGIQDRFGQSGTPEELLAEYGLDLESVKAEVEEML